MIKVPERTGYKIEIDTKQGEFFTHTYTVDQFDKMVEDYLTDLIEPDNVLVNVIATYEDGTETILQSNFPR